MYFQVGQSAMKVQSVHFDPVLQLMENYLDLAERLIAKCQINWNTTSLEVCDGIVHELQMYMQDLAENTQDVTDSSSHNTSQDLVIS